MAFTVLIPARYASTRLPGKPLADIAGKPMVVRVAERARAAARRASWSRPTTSGSRGGRARTASPSCMTRADHPTGTDRLAEAAAQLGPRRRRDRRQRAGRRAAARAGADPRRWPTLLAAQPDAAIATACHPIADPAEAFNPNVVKVVLDARGLCAVLQPRDDSLGARRVRADARTRCRRACRCTATTASTRIASASCARIPTLAPAPIERFEALEQLRALWHGYRIVVEITHGTPAPGVDTPRTSSGCARSSTRRARAI